MSLYDKLKTGIIGGGGLAEGKIFSLKPIDGSGDFAFSRASDGTRRNSAGAIVTEPINMPRADYKLGRTCPAILSEPLVKNVVYESDDFGVGYWSAGGYSRTQDGPINPKGEISWRITKGGGNYIASHSVVGTETGGEMTFSIWLKGSVSSRFNMQKSGGDYISYAFLNYDVQEQGDWQRHQVTFTKPNDGSRLRIATDGFDAEDYLFVFGAQLEYSPTATSYIYTKAGPSTRQPDIIEQLQPTTESFNSPKGTIFLRTASITTDDEQRAISFNDGGTNEIRIRYYNQGIGVRMIVDGVNVASFSTQQLDQTPFRNIAFNWDETSCSFWVDGEEIGSSILTESYPADTLDRTEVTGDNPFRGWLEELDIYDNNDIDLEDLTDYNTFEEMANNFLYSIQ